LVAISSSETSGCLRTTQSHSLVMRLVHYVARMSGDMDFCIDIESF
jgi:hypothetical protein